MNERKTALQDPRFWAWAREHGLVNRGPRGSPQNKERAAQVPGLVRAYLKEKDEAAKHPG